MLKYMVFKYTFLGSNASHAVFHRTAMPLIAACCVVWLSVFCEVSDLLLLMTGLLWSVCLSMSQSPPYDVVIDFETRLHILFEILKYMKYTPQKRFQCYLIHRVSIQGYRSPKRIKLQKKFPFPPFLPPKHP